MSVTWCFGGEGQVTDTELEHLARNDHFLYEWFGLAEVTWAEGPRWLWASLEWSWRRGQTGNWSWGAMVALVRCIRYKASFVLTLKHRKQI